LVFQKYYKPKDEPYVERVIRTYQLECLNYNRHLQTVAELQKVTDNWLDDYHSFRPHESLGIRNFDEFCAIISKSVVHQKVSLMY
jgi:transposase InsO family protein